MFYKAPITKQRNTNICICLTISCQKPNWSKLCWSASAHMDRGLYFLCRPMSPSVTLKPLVHKGRQSAHADAPHAHAAHAIHARYGAACDSKVPHPTPQRESWPSITFLSCMIIAMSLQQSMWPQRHSWSCTISAMILQHRSWPSKTFLTFCIISAWILQRTKEKCSYSARQDWCTPA